MTDNSASNTASGGIMPEPVPAYIELLRIQREHRYQLLRLWLPYAWVFVALVAVAMAGWVFEDQVRCACKIANAQVEAAKRNGPGGFDQPNPTSALPGPLAPTRRVPGVGDNDSLPLAGYLLAKLNELNPNDRMNRASLMKMINGGPYRGVGEDTKRRVVSSILVDAADVAGNLSKYAGQTVAEKFKVVDEAAKKGIDVVGDLVVEAGKKGLEKLFGDPEGKKVVPVESQSQIQVCMAPSYNPPRATSRPPHTGSKKAASCTS